MSRILVSSGSPYEKIVGFSRAVRVGNLISVAETTAASSGKPVAIGDAAAQTRAILATISEALGKADASMADTPFIMVTAEAQQDNIILAVKAKVSQYIVKPFTAETLGEKIDKVFG